MVHYYGHFLDDSKNRTSMNKSIIIGLLLSNSLALNASELDLGMGIGAMYYPDYLGSNINNTRYIPYPYIAYRSENLEIDGDGLQQDIFDWKSLSVRLSVSGSLPVNSSGARDKMSDLDPSVEIGPALVYTLYDKDGLSFKFDFPIRAVISSDFKGVDYRGYIYDPKLSFEYDFADGYNFQLHTGGVFANQKYHDYIYGVKPNDVMIGRDYYKAKAGYSGYKTSMGISKKFDNFWIGSFVRHYSLRGSSFKNSPLVSKNSAIYGGFFMAYIFDKSYTDRIKNWIE